LDTLTDRLREAFKYIYDTIEGLQEVETTKEKMWDIKKGEKLTVIFHVRLIGYRQPVYIDVDITYGNSKLDKEKAIERRDASYEIAHRLVSFLRYYITTEPINRGTYSAPLNATGHLARTVNRSGNTVRITAYYTRFLMKLPIRPYKEGRYPPIVNIINWMRAKGMEGNPYAISTAIAKRGFQTERLCLDKVVRNRFVDEHNQEILKILILFGIISGYNVGINVYDVEKKAKFNVLVRYSGGKVWC